MKMNGGNRGYCLGARVAIVASLLAGFGCGSADLESEPIGRTAEAVNVGDWTALTLMGETGTYTLTANIDASGKTWTPKDFSGTFDGGDHTISNLTINVPTWNQGGFFASMSSAIVRRVKFVNLRINGGQFVGGLAGESWDSLVEDTAVEVTITGNGSAGYVGGVFGKMTHGTVTRTYTKGSITGRWSNAGGIVGEMWGSGGDHPTIVQSYSQMAVTPDTPGTAIVYAGGIAGSAYACRIGDVYQVGNVTGRGGVGGLVGRLDADSGSVWLLYNSISRGGDVSDKNKSGGWEGTVGSVNGAYNRFSLLFFDAQADPTTAGANTSYNAPEAQHGHTTNELRLPTTATGGVFCVGGGDCGDGKFDGSVWDAGGTNQHHILKDMPGPNVQSR
jgi:hypothetical protein